MEIDDCLEDKSYLTGGEAIRSLGITKSHAVPCHGFSPLRNVMMMLLRVLLVAAAESERQNEVEAPRAKYKQDCCLLKGLSRPKIERSLQQSGPHRLDWISTSTSYE